MSPLPRWRWWIHLFLLSAFTLGVGVLGFFRKPDAGGPLLPENITGLLLVSVRELAIFTLLMALAWSASRFNTGQLLLKWRGGARPMLLGFAYSIGLRLGIALLAAMAAVIWFGLHGSLSASDLQRARPEVEQLVSPNALGNPLYLALVMTLISFVVAGLREELWRACMLAGVRQLFPRQFATAWGKAFAIAGVAVIFGLGHAVQGGAAIVATALLGAGLGTIMVLHRSIWEAVLAHGFFDATSFGLLCLVAKFLPQALHGGG